MGKLNILSGYFPFFRVILIVFIQLCFSIAGVCQSKRGNIGIFGNGVGLDFNHDPVEVLVLPPFLGDNRFDCFEGPASICDRNGNLLFYTDGTHAWNRANVIMPNGRFIQPQYNAPTTTTQCVIIPLPKDPFQYYIISAGFQGRDLRYSLVDMRLNNGMGDVVFKDSVIYKYTTEKMCVIKHSSEEALWLVTHEMGTDKFRANLVDENGLHANYVESTAGVVHVHDPDQYGNSGTNAIGYMKASHSGNLIACAISGEMGTFEFFEFNRTTGEVFNGVQLLTESNRISYGVEFSPDDSKLYLSCIQTQEFFQFDLQAGGSSDIINSKTLIFTGVSGAIQLGPDGKIYVNGRRSGYSSAETLDVIHEPNAKGALCNFQKNAVHLKGKIVYTGLPEFLYDAVDPEITYDQYCTGKQIAFGLDKIKQFTSIIWNFGDPEAGAANESTSSTPHHIYQKPGRYNVQILVSYADGSTFVYDQPITIYQTPSVTLANDTTLCPLQKITLTPLTDPSVTSFKWSDGAISASKIVSETGLYKVTVNNGWCSASDSVQVKFLPPSVPYNLKDTVLCLYQTLHLSLPAESQYTWEDGTNGNEKLISDAGKYKVQIKSRCESHQSNFKVSFMPKLNLNLTSDTLLCEKQTLTLDVSIPGAKYSWQDSITSPSYTIIEKGIYWVKVYNRCESLLDTIRVKYDTDISVFIPNVITPNGDGINDYFELDEKLKPAKVEILNRWGNGIYSSRPYQNDWQGEGSEPGIYFYLVSDRCSVRKGWIHVMK
jgi:gliding motility-associated-like protein